MKKIIASAFQCLSIILIIFGIQSVSQNDALECKITIDNTFALDTKIFDFIVNKDRSEIGQYSVLFWLALIILLIASIIMYKTSKIKATIMIISNIIFTTGGIIFYTNGNYIIMMILISTLVTAEIFVLGWSKSIIGIITSVLTGCIGILNIFFLIEHLSMTNYFNQVAADLTDNKINEFVNISRINMACFGLFVIPCILNIVNTVIFKRNNHMINLLHYEIRGDNMEQSKEYNQLYSQYKNKTNEELSVIANSGDEYTPIAKQVANDVLNSDRTEYKNKIQQQNDEYVKAQQKIEITKSHPLYNDIHQITGDIRFLKNLVILGIVLGVVLTVIGMFLL